MPTTLEELRARYAAAPNETLLKLSDPARRRVAPLAPEAWLALAEEMERRGLPMPDDPAAAALLDDVGDVASPPRDPRTGLVRYPRASRGMRFVAMLIDSVVMAVPMGIVMALVVGSMPIPAGPTPDPEWFGRFFGTMMLVILIGSVYSFLKDGLPGGRSLGKRAVGLMVVRLRTNTPCTYGASAMRALVMFALGLIPLAGPFIEPIMVLVAEDGRRLGDRAAETQVVALADYRP